MANIIFSQGSGVADSVFGKSQDPIRMMLEKRGEAFEAMSALPSLFAIEKSSKYAEKLTTMTAMDNFQAVGENGAYPLTGWQEGYSKVIEHITWKNSFALSKEIMDDATTIDLRKRPEAFIATYYRTRENLGAGMYAAAIKGEKAVSFGGKLHDATTADNFVLFSNKHASKLGKGNDQCNAFTDDITSTGVDAAEVIAALESRMQNFRGDNGEVLDVAPDTILIPNNYKLKKAVFEAIGADKDPATDHNGFNYIFGRWNVIVWSYLNNFLASGSNPMIMLDSRYNKTYIGAAMLDRETLSVKSDIDENTDANVWRGRARFGCGFNDWRFAACVGMTSVSSTTGTLGSVL